MKWVISDAIMLALDMRENREIAPDQLDETANALWAEMQAENESGEG